jgi:hypothetical protein
MTTKAKVTKKVAELGFMISDDGCQLTLDAPNGSIFAGIDSHWMIYDYEFEGRKWIWPAMWADLNDTKPCVRQECEVCTSEKEQI